ncbi:hypothetical protein L9F63_023867, partial [Diploptera punctata]
SIQTNIPTLLDMFHLGANRSDTNVLLVLFRYNSRNVGNTYLLLLPNYQQQVFDI